MSIFLLVKKKVMGISRKKKLEHFYSLCKSGQSVLDVGVSQDFKKLPALNQFLKTYRYNPETYTGLGVQDLSAMQDLYPGKRFIQYPGGKFPFKDNEFEWVFSNAVIEHVGDDEDQLLFLNEMIRVGKNVFFTTPNKYFLVESHTNVFFLHWNNKLFYKWCSRNKNKTAYNQTNLYLFSYNRLKKLLENSLATSFSIYKNKLIGIPMTFTVVSKGQNQPYDDVADN